VWLKRSARVFVPGGSTHRPYAPSLTSAREVSPTINLSACNRPTEKAEGERETSARTSRATIFCEAGYCPDMNPLALLALIPVLTTSAFAADLGKLIFEDDFNRNESQETTDDPGNGWGTNSKSRAKGDKQVDLKDGAMRIYISARADHAVTVTHAAEFTDGTVTLRFMLEDAKDSLGLDFADAQLKEVHAGHLFAAKVDPKQVQMIDHKTGGMRVDIHDARTEKKPLTDEQKKALEGKTKSVPHATELGKWHELQVKMDADEISVAIDGQAVGSFRSPGIAHPTKRMLRLSVPRNAVVDDVKIYRKG
jgi:hypothetical protein